MRVYKDESLCRLCNEEAESSFHISFECAALPFECAARSQRRIAMQSQLAFPFEKDLQNRLVNLTSLKNLIVVYVLK